MVEKAKADMNRYVMNDVFTSVLVGADGKSVTGSQDLFTNYLNPSEDEVAASNKWYQTCASFKIAATDGHENFPFIVSESSAEI